jgi:broad specificity phosphatase PhoE
LNETRIDLIRHGEPVGGRRIRGHGIDDPLSETGWAQMRSAVGDGSPWARVVSSPMQRCLAFAKELATRQQLPLQIDDRLKEVGFGAWEGRTPDQIRTDNAEEYDAFYSDPVNRRPAGAEPLQEFSDRVGNCYDELVSRHAGEHLLLVTHAGVIRAVLSRLLDAPLGTMYRMEIANAGIARVRHTPRGVRVDGYNLFLC